jgi:hypothetical protein
MNYRPKIKILTISAQKDEHTLVFFIVGLSGYVTERYQAIKLAKSCIGIPTRKSLTNF